MNHKKNILSLFVFLIFSTIFMYANDHESEKESFLNKMSSLTEQNIEEYLNKNPQDWLDVNNAMKGSGSFHLQPIIRRLYWPCRTQAQFDETQE